MSKELREDAQLIELVRQINFLLTGRYVSVNTTPIQKAIDRYAEQRELQAELERLYDLMIFHSHDLKPFIENRIKVIEAELSEGAS